MMHLPSLVYLPPQYSEYCQCKDNSMRAMFCMTGHMLECHFPMDCLTAGCSHLEKYDWTVEQASAIREVSHANILKMADQDCETCSGSGTREVTSPLLGKIEGLAEVKVNTLCNCVIEAMIRAGEKLVEAQQAMRFDLGTLQMTAGARERWERLEVDPNQEAMNYIVRHVTGDWGDLDAEDKALNDRALEQGDRLLSRYEIGPGFTIYVITEANRSYTTVLLSDEY